MLCSSTLLSVVNDHHHRLRSFPHIAPRCRNITLLPATGEVQHGDNVEHPDFRVRLLPPSSPPPGRPPDAWVTASHRTDLPVVSQLQLLPQGAAASAHLHLQPHCFPCRSFNSPASGFLPATQLHFHSPSEHTINGVHYPLELHIVNQVSGEKEGRAL